MTEHIITYEGKRYMAISRYQFPFDVKEIIDSTTPKQFKKILTFLDDEIFEE